MVVYRGKMEEKQEHTYMLIYMRAHACLMTSASHLGGDGRQAKEAANCTLVEIIHENRRN